MDNGRNGLIRRFGDSTQVTVAVPLVAPDLEGVRQQWLAAAKEKVDILEWRLDLLDIDRFPLGLPQLFAACADLASELRESTGLPVLATWRTADEGGAFVGAESDYVAAVSSAAGWADVVDVEAAHPRGERLISTLRTELPVVASFHRFTPGVQPALVKLTLESMQDRGATVAKIAWMCGDSTDAQLIMEAQRWADERLDIPAAVMGMGDCGEITRLGEAARKSAFVFATLGHQSAPGQPTLSRLMNSLRGT